MTSLYLMLCAGQLALAAPVSESPPAVEAGQATEMASQDTPPSEGGLQYEAVLRAEYLAGQPVLVPIRVRNTGNEAADAPDIERRPWLVAFTFDQGNGELERRLTTPPASDPGRMVRLASRTQRRTVLEIPASSGLKPAEYKLQVTLDPDTLTRVLATGTIRVAQPHPVHADMARSVSAARRATDTRVWLHKATEGFDLYLSPLPSGSRRVSARWLLHVESPIQPILSEASSGEGGPRHVVWTRDKRSFGWVSLDALGEQLTPHIVETPWPELELVGRPATDAAGHLHVPVWIPAPTGTGGELRIITVLDRGTVSYRRAGIFPDRPASIATTVDDSGAVQLLVATDTTVDLYTIRAASPSPADLPIPGRRVARSAAGSRYVDVRFGLRASTETQKGGLSILATTGESQQLRSDWLSLRGAELARGVAIPIPENADLRDILPGSTACGYLFKTGKRQAVYLEGDQKLVLNESLHGDWGLVRAGDGTPLLVRTANQTIFQTTPLASLK